MKRTSAVNSVFRQKFQALVFGLYDFSLLVKDTVKNLPAVMKNKKETLQEMYVIGTQALLLVTIGGVFTGMILAIEAGHGMEKFGAVILICKTISLGVIRETGPVITGILLAGRTGAKNTSEIGAMQLSEQVEALSAFGINPVEKLVVPRVVAAVIMFVPLTLIADLTGILGGMFIANTTFKIDLVYFWNTATSGLQFKDLFVGAVKPLFFAFFIAVISCYYGLKTRGGTTNLGKNAISSVVTASAMVLVLDFIFSKIVWELL